MKFGLRLDDLPSPGLSWRDLLVIVKCAPQGSALQLAMNPSSRQTYELSLLRSIEQSLRWIGWTKTADGHANRNIPQPWRFPWEPEQAGVFDSDVMDVDEMRRRLGWPKAG